MKIQKGKVAIALLVLILMIPLSRFAGSVVEERAVNRCTATPGDSADFLAYVEFKWSSMSWACQREYTNEQGEKNGLVLRVSFPLIP
jgi:hypothetical protein